MKVKESWSSKIGVILAVAGSAVGLGNFLRFPGEAARNGGGAFMIPYFAAFILLGIPLMWVEWSIGRFGGKYGHSTLPAMYQRLTGRSWAKYPGVFGLILPFVVIGYYTYIESMTLGYSVNSLLGKFDCVDIENCSTFLGEYISLDNFSTIVFFLLTVAMNYYVLYKGVSGGIEKLCKVAMPALFLIAVVIMIKVFTLDGISKGLGFMWNPEFSLLKDPSIWLAATGQIFFTLSLGFGVIQTYASYLKKDEDIALSGLSSASLNGFAEVVLGASISIPAAVVFFGASGAMDVAESGTFNIAFITMPVIFQNMGSPTFYGFLWFFLLFIAGVTSSISLGQPMIAFLEDEFGFSRRKAVNIIFLGIIAIALPAMVFINNGFLDELDFWCANFLIVVSATIEMIIFAWVFGIEKGWSEITRGAMIKIPVIFKWIITYVTPVYLILLLGIWLFRKMPEYITNVNPDNLNYIWGARGMMIALLLILLFLISKSCKDFREEEL